MLRLLCIGGACLALALAAGCGDDDEDTGGGGGGAGDAAAESAARPRRDARDDRRPGGERDHGRR